MRTLFLAASLAACTGYKPPTEADSAANTGTDPVTDSATEPATDTSTEPVTATPIDSAAVPDSCVDELAVAVPTLIAGTAVGDEVAPSCVGAGRADHVVSFTAPTAGRYLFDARGSELYDLVGGQPLGQAAVALLDGCGGAELACSPYTTPAPSGAGGSAAVELAAGQTVLAVVDVASESETFVLEISEPPRAETACDDGVDEDYDALADCVDSDCAAAPNCVPACPDGVLAVGTYAGTTTGLPDEVAPSCDPYAPAPDESLTFTPPASGRYRFEFTEVPGLELVPELVVTDGCGGVEIACGTAAVVVDLVGGAPVTVHATGRWGTAGPYVLSASEVPSAEDSCDDGVDEDYDGPSDCLDSDCAGDPTCQFVCPDLDLGSTPGTVAGTTLGQPMSPGISCVFGGWDTSVTQVSFTAPSAGDYVFAVDGENVGGLAVTDGCGGAELGCDADLGVDQLVVTLAAGQTVTAKVSVAVFAGGPFELTVQELATDEAGTCFDGIDGDADGLVDCVDLDCGGVDPGCVEGCDTVADEDGDTLVDCLDPDCSGDAHCVEACPQAEIADPYGIGVYLASGTTVGAADDLAGSCGGAGASDVALAFTAPQAGVYTIVPTLESLDPRWYVLDGDCAGAELLCAADGNLREVQLAAGQTVIVVMDGAGLDADGWYDVSVIF